MSAAYPQTAESSTLAVASRRYGAYLAGACPVILGVVRRLSDGINHEPMWMELMAPLVSRLPGSAGSPGLAKRRGFVGADYVVRRLAPQALRVLGVAWPIAALESCAPIVDASTAREARFICEGLRKRAIAREDAGAKTIANYASAIVYASYADGDANAASIAYYEGVAAARECMAHCSVEELRPSYVIAAQMIEAMLKLTDQTSGA